MTELRAAEAKYAAMAGTAEKLEATLKKLKGTAQTCQWSIDQLHRSVEKDKASDRARIVVFVLWPWSGGIFKKKFYGRLPCESLMLWELGGEADANLLAAQRGRSGMAGPGCRTGRTLRALRCQRISLSAVRRTANCR